MKDKNNAINDYIEMTLNSWTYDRLTDDEKLRCIKALKEAKLIGTWQQRWEQLQNIYYAFLLALDYKPIGWRERSEAEQLAHDLMKIDDSIDRPCRPHGMKYVELVMELAKLAKDTVKDVDKDTLGDALEIITNENYHSLFDAVMVAYGFNTIDMVQRGEYAFCNDYYIDFETGEHIA